MKLFFLSIFSQEFLFWLHFQSCPLQDYTRTKHGVLFHCHNYVSLKSLTSNKVFYSADYPQMLTVPLRLNKRTFFLIAF
jgi:hypothetical protein